MDLLNLLENTFAEHFRYPHPEPQ